MVCRSIICRIYGIDPIALHSKGLAIRPKCDSHQGLVTHGRTFHRVAARAARALGADGGIHDEGLK